MLIPPGGFDNETFREKQIRWKKERQERKAKDTFRRLRLKRKAKKKKR